MSQPYSQCSQCNTPITPENRFCPGCGAVAPGPTTHTYAASPYPSSGNISPTELAGPRSFPYPSSGNHPPTEPASPHSFPYSSSGNFPPSPAFSSTPPAPPPPDGYDPYAPISNYGQPLPTYGNFQGYPTPPQKKKASTPLIIVGVIVVLLAALFGSIYAFSKVPGSLKSQNGQGSDQNGNVASSQQLNLSTIYASDQITFTSIQQDAKFSDDAYTSFKDHSNYVRVNFKERQLSKKSSYFSYHEAFHLLLPDKSVVSITKAQALLAPEQEVVRTNWIDFATDNKVDLGQLTLRIGAADENQIDVPLKTGADLTKYQPKTTTLNKAFQYASIPWKLVSATQSPYFEGKQAKTGQVYITVALTTNNTSQNNLYLYNFLRLKSGEAVTSPDYGSNLDDFYSVKANTTNIQGSGTFLATPSSTYTLILRASTDNTITEQTVNFHV